jgi:hypothetical protein
MSHGNLFRTKNTYERGCLVVKKRYVRVVLIICLLSIFTLGGCKKAIGSYPNSIAWDNISYGVSTTEVSKDALGKQLGEIKRKKEPTPIKNGDANDTPVGSKLFEIKGIDAKEAIAIEKNGKVYKAIQNGPLE